MKDRIQLSQREQWRRKHAIRVFLEEQALELRDVVLYFTGHLNTFYEFLWRKNNEYSDHIMANQVQTFWLMIGVSFIVLSLV